MVVNHRADTGVGVSRWIILALPRKANHIALAVAALAPVGVASAPSLPQAPPPAGEQVTVSGKEGQQGRLHKLLSRRRWANHARARPGEGEASRASAPFSLERDPA